MQLAKAGQGSRRKREAQTIISALALISIYKGPVVALSEICERYFNLSYEEALKAAARNELPVPAFRLRDSRKAPMMVSCQALGDYIDACEERARQSWVHSQTSHIDPQH